MAEVSFKALILTEAQLAGEEAVPPVPDGLSDPTKAWPVLEVMASSFADSVVIHRMDDHDELLVFLMSRGQAYARDAEGLTPPHRLTAEELDSHLKAAPAGGIAAVPWSTPLVPGVRAAKAFLSLFEDETFRRLAQSSQVIAEYGIGPEAMRDKPMSEVIRHQGKGTTKAIMAAVASHVGTQGAAAALGQALGLRSAWTRDADIATDAGCNLIKYHDALDVFENPEPIVDLSHRFGLDTSREYLKRYLGLASRDTWLIEQASLRDFLDITERLDVKMKPNAFLTYATDQRAAQGANIFDGTHWLDLWADTLAMQDLVHGQVDDKYPQELMVAHDQLIREAVRVRHAIQQDDDQGQVTRSPFEIHRDELAENSYHDEHYIIRPPHDVQEMLDEARQQQNCLAGYVKAFEHGDTDIYLMRRTSSPDTPCVTVEVRDGRVRQAFQRANQRLTEEQQEWFDSWCDNHHINRDRYDRALWVGIEYRDDAAPRHVDPLVAAQRQDRVTNRPGAWRR
ncbi:MAG: PcfJ domain-containing protein [Atopobiaceae bacterium]|nr:PcfJ domain-containing protein [Atopobiaceae bacterium]